MADPKALAAALSEDLSPLPMRFSWGPRYNPSTNKMDAPDLKGVGFYGPQSLGIGGDIAGEYASNDMINGVNRDYPEMVPGMSPQQLGTVLAAAKMHQPVPRAIDDIAYKHAKERVNAGKSPFWDQRIDKYPAWSPDQHWEKPAVMPKGK